MELALGLNDRSFSLADDRGFAFAGAASNAQRRQNSHSNE
jgi:hypothetical protein